MLMTGGIVGSSFAVALHFSAFSKFSAASMHYTDNQLKTKSPKSVYTQIGVLNKKNHLNKLIPF